METTKTLFLLFWVMFLASSTTLSAQTTSGFAGKYGNFIFLGNELAKAKNARIISKVNVPLAEVGFPNSEEDFVAKVHAFYAQNPYFPMVTDSILGGYWQWATAYSNIDSLPQAAKQLDVLVGLGVVYFDPLTDYRTDIIYEITQTNAEKSRVVVTAPVRQNLPKFKFAGKQIGSNHIVADWFAIGNPQILKVDVYKQHLGQDDLNRVDLPTYLFRNNDSVSIRVMDTSILKGLTYRYFISLVDPFGWENNLADTLTILHTPENSLPVFIQAKAESDEFAKGIRLNWKLQNLFRVQAIDIFRSLHFDSAFVQIGTVAATDTTFLDLAVKPVTGYWYKMVLNGVFEREMEPVKIAGILKQGPEILPVSQVLANSDETGIQISWVKNSNSTRGYYVYRANGYSGEFEQVSDLLLANSSTDFYTFHDSSSQIKSGLPYSYTIKTLSDGYVLSQNSDTVSIIAPLVESLPFITQLEAYVEQNAVLVVWGNVQEFYPQLVGYQIFRLELDKWVLLQETSYSTTQYVDSNLQIGKSYKYKVVPIAIGDVAGGEMEIEVALTPPTFYAPEILNAEIQANTIVIKLQENQQERSENIFIYRGEVGSDAKRIASLKPTETTYIDKTIFKGKAYFYYSTLSAYGAESAPSAPLNINFP